MTAMESKKALILLDKNDKAKSLQTAERLCAEGYDLYAKGEMVLFFNSHMIPASVCTADCTVHFDCVIQ
ncbi:MAG: hypothetical protein PUC47_01950 [Oscillospiraceae bacterium]|nr:hypothetical protein [Oscillospiraceae bacterium]